MNWYKRHPGKQAAALRLHRYKLTHEEYEALLKEQHRRCAICRKKTKLTVDHIHLSGKVRGLLCHHCNTGIGLLGESIKTLAAAIDYITTHEGTLPETTTTL